MREFLADDPTFGGDEKLEMLEFMLMNVLSGRSEDEIRPVMENLYSLIAGILGYDAPEPEGTPERLESDITYAEILDAEVVEDTEDEGATNTYIDSMVLD